MTKEMEKTEKKTGRGLLRMSKIACSWNARLQWGIKANWEGFV